MVRFFSDMNYSIFKLIIGYIRTKLIKVENWVQFFDPPPTKMLHLQKVFYDASILYYFFMTKIN